MAQWLFVTDEMNGQEMAQSKYHLFLNLTTPTKIRILNQLLGCNVTQ